MERVRIAVLDAYDNVLAFMDNGAPKALHYYEDELHEYLKGTANTLTFCAGAKHEDAQYLVEGNKLSFLYRGKEYYLNIMNIRRDELEVEVTAYSLSFELLNEEKEKYAATEAKTFAEYLSIFDAEKVITLGNNEVSDKSIKHEWEGADTMLARIFSLATVFDVEVEFIPQLNDNYSLKEIRMNVYKEHSDTIQGIGVNRNDITLRYGKNVTGITKTSDITGLYTAIRPFGRDGLTITDLDKTEYDADGNLEYYTESGSNNILAPQARDRFPSNLWSAKDRYIAKIYKYDTDNVNTLYGNALSELKKNCVPRVEYEVSGYFDTDIGDTVQIEDDEYNPALYLEARVTGQIRSFTDPTRNKTTFDNFHELQSQLDSDLVAKMNALIEQNKTYTCMISTDNGTTFKNNTGSTILTASVRDGVTDVTDKFTIVWSKDGADLATGKSITVNAADVDGKALYRFDAKDSAGNVKGFYEVTVTDVSDGTDGVSPTVEVNEDTSLTITDSEGTKNTGPLKGADGISSYTHIKYSDDGETFTGKGNLASRKREDWVKGYYSSDTTIDTEAPDKMTASSNYNRICMKKLIPVVPGDTYQITSGHPFIGMGITKYGADGNSVGIDTVDGSLSIQQYKVPDDTYHVRLYMSGSSPYVTKYGSWSELFEKNSVSPMFGEPESKLGSYPGAWMGQMVSDDPTPSTVFEDYTWVKVKGDPGKDGLDGLQGEKGDQGIPGKDGTNSYTHIAYANSADGHTDFSVSDSDREYIGMYVDDQLTDSENPDDYRWTLVKGQDGANGTPGKAGEDGRTPYIHIAYANSADGQTDFSVTESDGKSYIGQYTDYEEPDSTDPNNYAWSKIKGDDGADGKDGTSSYTHIKYSDDGKTFTQVENYASENREDWLTGYYGTGSTTADEQPNKATDSYKSLSMARVIQIDPNETYQCSSGNDGVKLYFTLYDANGAYLKLYNPGEETFKFPSGVSAARMYLTCANTSIVSSLESWDELFSSGDVSPVFKMAYATEGDKPGAWMGALVSQDPEPSLVFSDYAWKKIEGDPTGIVESNDEPSDKYVGMLWKNTGTTSGLVQGATYRWNGTEWEMYKFSATNIEAETFKGYKFYGSIFESEFIEKLDALHRTEGKVTIKDGRITVVANSQTNDLGSENGWNTVSTDKMTIDGYGLEIESDTHMRQLRIQHLLAVAKLLDVRETEEGGDQRNGYRKYASGRMEQWITVEKTLDATNAWGGCYISAKQAAQEYPVPFLSVPSVQITVTGNGTDGAWIMMLDEGTATQSPRYHLVRAAELNEAKEFKILIRAWGECEKEEEII